MAVNPVEASPELESAILRARRRAEAAGELGPRRPVAPVPAEVQEVLRKIVRDGSFADAVARIGAQDPDLADQ